MSDVMMAALQMQVESLTRQVKTIGLENERVRKLLTEFDARHDADKARIEALEAENARLKHALVVWDQAHRTGRNEPLQVAFDIGKEALMRAMDAKP